MPACCAWRSKAQAALPRQGHAKHIAQQTDTILEDGQVDDGALQCLKRMLRDAGCATMGDKERAARVGEQIDGWFGVP